MSDVGGSIMARAGITMARADMVFCCGFDVETVDLIENHGEFIHPHWG